MTDYKLVNGERVELTPAEQAEHDARAREASMNKHTERAIRNTHPPVVKIVYNDPIEAFDSDGQPVEIDFKAVEVELVALEIAVSNEAYRARRAAEYPSVGDQLDALWKGGDEAAEMKAKIDAVKSKHPKPVFNG